MSGADKQALTLPIFVSAKAYLVEPEWLNTWLALLQSEDFGFERDYLLPLADETLTAACTAACSTLTLSGIPGPS